MDWKVLHVSDWHELPSFMLEPPEQDSVTTCDCCSKSLPKGAPICIYENYPVLKVFCSHDCAFDWLATVLEEETAE